jgi:hypothetical protein
MRGVRGSVLGELTTFMSSFCEGRRRSGTLMSASSLAGNLSGRISLLNPSRYASDATMRRCDGWEVEGKWVAEEESHARRVSPRKSLEVPNSLARNEHLVTPANTNASDLVLGRKLGGDVGDGLGLRGDRTGETAEELLLLFVAPVVGQLGPA